MVNAALRDFVRDVGRNMGRSPSEVEPYATILNDNWFDNPATLASTKPEELASLGVPLRFAQALCNEALRPPAIRSEEPSKGKAKSKGRGKEDRGDRREERWEAERRDDRRDDRRDQRDNDAYYNKQVPPAQITKTIRIKNYSNEKYLRGVILGKKGGNLMHIQNETGAKIDLRGGGDEGEPMHLSITAEHQRDVGQAIKLARDLLETSYAHMEEDTGKGGWEEPSSSSWRKGGYDDRDHRGSKGKGSRDGKGLPKDGKGSKDRKDNKRKREDGDFKTSIDLPVADVEFNYKGKLIGAKGRNLRQIQDKTGARCHVEGEQGSAMTFDITAPSEEALDQARELAEEVISRLTADYEDYKAGLDAVGSDDEAGGKPKGKGGRKAGKGAGRRDRGSTEDWEFTESREIMECDPGFSIRGKIIGRGGSNVKKLEEQSGAKLKLENGEGDALSLVVRARSQSACDQALSSIDEFLSKLYAEYDEWLASGGSDGQGADDGGAKDDREAPHRAPRDDNRGDAGANRQRKRCAKVIRLKDSEDAFGMRSRVKGANCENLFKIQDETGAVLWLQDSQHGEPQKLEVSADNEETLEKAMHLARELVKSIYKEYNLWLKGSSKGKGRDGGRDERSPKRRRQ